MVKINDRFYITADSMSYKVMEKTINKDEGSKNFGKETESIVGYYTTIEQCMQGILKILSREYVSKRTINSISDLKEEIARQTKMIKDCLGDMKI